MKIISKHWHQTIQKLNSVYVKQKICDFLNEDRANQDHTTRLTISKHHNTTYVMEAEDNIIFAGIQVLTEAFSACDLKTYKNDGDYVKKKEKICEIKGPTRVILSRERVVLNLIQRLCGIATLTNEYVKIVKKSKNPKIQILDTRKTTPGLRLFEKYAVSVGGGKNHRHDLSDGVLIKDNHIIHSDITETLLLAQYDKQHKIEVEVDTLKQLSSVLPLMPDGILLDNFKPTQIIKAINIIKAYPSNHQVFIEASGGINKQSLHRYLIKGLSAISVGALTHQAKSKNIKLVKKN